MVGVGYVYCLQKIVFTPIETTERSDQIVLRSTCMFGMDFRRSPSQPINHIYINIDETKRLTAFSIIIRYSKCAEKLAKT